MDNFPATQDNHKTILVVDDDPIVLEFVSGLLSETYTVLSASNGADAITCARSHVGTIHLLLSDFQMPGITGIDLATQIFEERPEMRVLLMSGFTGGMLVLNEGWHFLAKPFIPSQLRSIVRNLLTDGSHPTLPGLTSP